MRTMYIKIHVYTQHTFCSRTTCLSARATDYGFTLRRHMRLSYFPLYTSLVAALDDGRRSEEFGCMVYVEAYPVCATNADLLNVRANRLTDRTTAHHIERALD